MKCEVVNIDIAKKSHETNLDKTKRLNFLQTVALTLKKLLGLMTINHSPWPQGEVYNSTFINYGNTSSFIKSPLKM